MKNNLNSFSKKDLIKIAEALYIPNPTKYRKKQLIELIQKKKATVAIIQETRKAVEREKLKTVPATTKEPRLDTKPYYEPSYHEEMVTTPQAVSVSEVSQPFAISELPHSYGETKIVLMVRDPSWAYAYWDIDQAKQAEINKIFQEKYGEIKPILRIYDVTDVEFNGLNAHRTFDLDIHLEARNWYINLGGANRSYLIDLGLIDSKGNFYLIARSNQVKTPRDGPSEIVDEEWMCRDFEEIYALSGGLGVGLSSAELKEKRKKLFEQLLFSGAFISSPGMILREIPRKKDFFLQVATELILYGRTYADATLTLNGKQVSLRPDGTFTVRYFLPDGVKSIPIKATSKEGDMSQSITVEVRKETR